MGFVSDALFDGRRLRALTVVDAYTREALAIDVDQGIKGRTGGRGDGPDRIGPRHAQGDPGGKWTRVCLEGAGPLGLREWCDAGLLAARQAYGCCRQALCWLELVLSDARLRPPS